MRRSFLDQLMKKAESAVVRGELSKLSDSDLLSRFNRDRDEAAFSGIVKRHGPLVWSVCRNMLPNESDAEDAFQAVFLALIKSSGSIRTPSVGSWLHGVAFRVAMKVRRTAVRRKTREKVAARTDSTEPVAQIAWDELQASVHEEVNNLPEKLRLPFVLCDLQGQCQKETARLLGLKFGTLSARLTHARQQLLEKLSRRGLSVGLIAGAATFASVTAISLPYRLSAKAVDLIAMPSDLISPVVMKLAHGVNTMFTTKFKYSIACVVVAGMLTTSIGTHLLSSADAQTNPGADDRLAQALQMLKKNPPNETQLQAILKAIQDIKNEQNQPTYANVYDGLKERKQEPEYKFVEVTGSITVEQFKKKLAEEIAAGWTYCGNQALKKSDKSNATDHLVFKKETKIDTVNFYESKYKTQFDAAKIQQDKARQSLELTKQKLLEQQQLFEKLHDEGNEKAKLEKRIAEDRLKSILENYDKQKELNRVKQIELLRKRDDEQAELDRAQEKKKLTDAIANEELKKLMLSRENAKFRQQKDEAEQKKMTEVATNYKKVISDVENQLRQEQKYRADAEQRISILEAKLKQIASENKLKADADVIHDGHLTSKFILKYADADSTNKILSDLFLKNLFSKSVNLKIAADSKTNSIIVNGTQKEVEEIAKAISILDAEAGKNRKK